MCLEHNTFMWVVDRRNLITVGRVWLLRHSHTVYLASVDHPHKAPDLIDSSRVLDRCRALSTVDADRTPLIDVCHFFGCFGSSADMLETMLKISLKFGGLTTLVAHQILLPELQAETLKNSLKPCAHFFFLFFLFLLEGYWPSPCTQGFPTPKFSLQNFFFKQKTAYEILRSDWSSDVCSSDLK